MYHFIESDLNIKSVAQLKDVYSQIGCTLVITDKRIKTNWVQAILTHQSALVEKVQVADVKVDDQSAAQTEEIKTVEISFYNHEVYKGDQQIASITHDSDDFQTQRWVVMVGETEVHRANSWAKCFEYVRWHHKQGTLPVYEAVVTVAGTTQTQLVEASAVVTTTSNWNINLTSNSEIAICSHCDGVGCARCGYSGGLSVDLCAPTTSYRMTYFSRINNQAAYIARNGHTPIGMLFQTRNTEEFWDEGLTRSKNGQPCTGDPSLPIESIGNKAAHFYRGHASENETTSYYWQCGNSEKYWSLAEAFIALEKLTTPKTDDELLNTPFDELTQLEWERLKRHNKQLRHQLEKSFINDNFGCYNRAGAIARGNEFLMKERRRVASGELVMVCCDIAGMGRRNSEIGEVAVNNAIASSLKEIRSWRGVFFISQLNSGDEFVFIVDRVDEDGIVSRMNGVFKKYGFDGIYAAVSDIRADYIQSANTGMERVYQLKKVAV